MSLFEFVLVGVSIVLSLALTMILQGIRRVASEWRTRRLYWVHTVWITTCLLWLLRAWWQFWALSDKLTWTFAEFLLVMAHIGTMFVWLSLVLPIDRSDDSDGREFFFDIKDAFFLSGIVHLVVYMPFLVMLSAAESPDQPVWTLLPIGLVWIGMMGVARKTDRGWFHASWAVLNLLTLVGFALAPRAISVL